MSHPNLVRRFNMGIKIRRDDKGRVLKDGEFQRSDTGLYLFEYKDPISKKVRYLSAWRLEKTDRNPKGKRLKLSLREQEAELNRKFVLGANTASDGMTLEQLVNKYLLIREASVKESTRKGYKTVTNFMKTQPFYKEKIGDIKKSDAKAFIGYLQKDLKKSYSTIHTIKGVLKPAYDLACEDNMVVYNPFDFDLSKVIVNDSKKKVALKTPQKTFYLNYVKKDEHYGQYYSIFYILFELGLRISEFCGLTINDIDFDNKVVHVTRQLMKEKSGKYVATTLKTENGLRNLKMTDELVEQFHDLLSRRPKVDKEVVVKDIDGKNISGFICLDKDNTPCVATNIESRFRWCYNKYERIYKYEIPRVTPHTCRHTFATDLYRRGISAKTAQYLLGHGDIRTTLRIYTDSDEERAHEEYEQKTPEAMTYEDIFDELNKETEEE